MNCLLRASLIMASVSLSACSVTAGKDAGNPAPQGPVGPSPSPESVRGNTSGPNVVTWASVPSQYNPQVKTTNFSVVGISKVTLDIFLSGNVQVNYVPNLNPAAASISMFSVYKNSASFGGLEITPNGTILAIENSGQYECSIETDNGNITDLDGGCVVHVEVNLPAGAQVETYLSGELIGRRFFPMDNETLLKNVDRAFNDGKKQAIDDYLESYAETHKTPSIASKDLGTVLKAFSFKDDKIAALKKLQQYTADRDGLEAMIEDVFALFDQNDARDVVGLPHR